MARYALLLLSLLCGAVTSANARSSLAEVEDTIHELELKQDPALEAVISLQHELLEAVVHYDQALRYREAPEADTMRQKRRAKSKDYYLNLHVNIVPIGLDADALRSWLSTVSQDAALADLVIGNASQALQNVGYRYCFNLYELPEDVTEFIREQLGLMMLKTSNDANDHYYLLSWEVEELFHSLSTILSKFAVEHYALKDLIPDYSLFLLNVSPTASDRAQDAAISYGYQWGFGQEHMKQLAQDEKIISTAKTVLNSEELRRVYQYDRSIPRPTKAEELREEVDWHHWRDPVKAPDTAPCVRHELFPSPAREWMQQRKTRATEHQAYPSDIAARALKLLEDSTPSRQKYRLALAREVLQWNFYLRSQSTSSIDPSPSCQSPTWVGQRNVSWVDLKSDAAGAGPMMSARRPIPSLPTTGHSQNAQVDGLDDETDMRQNNDLLHQQLSRRIARLQAIREQISCPREEDTGEQPPQCDLLAQQLTFLTTVATKSAKLAALEETLVAKQIDGDYSLASSLHLALDAHASLLQEAADRTAPFSSPEAIARAENSKTENKFYADIAGYMQEFTRHIITPTTLLPPVRGTNPARQQQLLDEDIMVQIYVVKQRNTFEPLSKHGEDGFDLNAYVSGIRDLIAPWQAVTITTMVLPLDDDPSAALGLRACARSALVAALNEDQKYTSSLRQYLDSTCAIKVLKHDSGAAGQTPRSQRIISVFIVSVDLPRPLFLDRVHVAKAVDDSVVIVQNAQPTIPSSVLCDGRPQTIYGRNPLPEALGATAQALHGLLPSHTAHQQHPDWVWASGSSPLQANCRQPIVSSHEQDIIHRTALLHSLAEAITVVDEAFEATREARNDFYDPDALEQLELTIAHAYGVAKKCVLFMARRDWINARGAMNELLDATNRLTEHQHLREIAAPAAEAGLVLETSRTKFGEQMPGLRLVLFGAGMLAAAFITHRVLGVDTKLKGH